MANIGNGLALSPRPAMDFDTMEIKPLQLASPTLQGLVSPQGDGTFFGSYDNFNPNKNNISIANQMGLTGGDGTDTRGFFGQMFLNKDGTYNWGNIGTTALGALQLANGLYGAYNNYKGMKLAKQQMRDAKNAWNIQHRENVDTYNGKLDNAAAAAKAMSGTMDSNGIVHSGTAENYRTIDNTVNNKKLKHQDL